MPVPYGRGCYKRIRNRKSVKGWKDDGHRLQKIAVYKRCQIKGVLRKTAVTHALVQKSFYLFILFAAGEYAGHCRRDVGCRVMFGQNQARLRKKQESTPFLFLCPTLEPVNNRD